MVLGEACKNAPLLPNRTTNWRSYSAAVKERGPLQIPFDPSTVWLAEQNSALGHLHRRCYSGVLDLEGAVQTYIAAND